jgi:hypothetical protein
MFLRGPTFVGLLCLRGFFMDELRERAEVFSNLLNYEYNITLGKKGVRTDLCLSFEKVDFYHLIGLQYLKDRIQLRKNRERIFNQILNNELTFSQIRSSDLFCVIEKRFVSFVHIEQFLDSNGLVFKFNRRSIPSLKMKAEYILENSIKSSIAYICIDKTDNITDKYYCRSFFPKENIDYTARQIKYTLLYKEKVNTITREKIIQYDKLTPK